jgi:hypothetical protein
VPEHLHDKSPPGRIALPIVDPRSSDPAMMPDAGGVPTYGPMMKMNGICRDQKDYAGLNRAGRFDARYDESRIRLNARLDLDLLARRMCR